MADNFPPTSQLQQIEEQVSAGLPPSGPHIISQETVDTKRNILMDIAVIIGIVAMAAVTIILVFSLKSSPKKQIAQISPTPTTSPVITLRNQYTNPFDQSSEYTNPFSSTNNPFDNLPQ